MIFEKKEPQHIFLILAFIVGILLIVLTPPMCTPDENAHFMNAYSISQGDIFPEVVDGQVGRYVPKSVLDFTNLNNGKFIQDLDIKYSFKSNYYDSWLPANKSEKVFYATTLTTINPIGYIISSLGMAFGNIFLEIFSSNNVFPYDLLLFGRIFNLIFYITVIYMAIKTTPYFKKAMLVLALMPMSIFLGASVSYDAILIPSSMLLFAIILKILCSDENYMIGKKDIFMVFFSSFFLSGIKMAYLPFVIILLAIPINKFGNKKRFVRLSLITIGICLFVIVIPQILLKLSLHGYHIPIDKNVTLQKEYLFSNIFNFPRVLISSLIEHKVFYFNSFFGNLGNLDISFPIPIIIMFYCMFFPLVIYESCNIEKITTKVKLLAVLGFVLSISGIFYQTYITWTSIVVGVGARSVSGVQGRYFIPMALFVLMPFANSRLCKIKYKDKFNEIIAVDTNLIIIANSVLTVLIILIRYW